MSPTYSIRRGNRYRYYISRALVRGFKEAVGFLGRIGANDVERLVVETLSRQLSRPALMNDVATGIWSDKTRTLVRDAVERVVLSRGEVQIFRRVAAASPSSVEAGEGDAPTVSHRSCADPTASRPQEDYRAGSGSNSRHDD